MTEHLSPQFNDKVEEGKYRAMVQRAKMGPEVAAKADALSAEAPQRMRRLFAADAPKGRFYPYYATEEEYQAYRKVHPATHRWESLKP